MVRAAGHLDRSVEPRGSAQPHPQPEWREVERTAPGVGVAHQAELRAAARPPTRQRGLEGRRCAAALHTIRAVGTVRVVGAAGCAG